MNMILFITCGSTNISLNEIAFTTKEVEEFMSSIMSIDHQDLMDKLLGFTIWEVKSMSLFL